MAEPDYYDDNNIPEDNNLIEDGEEASPKIVYLRKLYFWLVLQYILVGVTCYCAYRFEDFNKFLKDEIAFTIVFASVAVLVLLGTYFGKPKTNTIPINIICFVLFTAGLAFTFAYIVVSGHPQVCLMLFLTIGMIIFALFGSVMTTKNELTYQSSTLFVVSALLLSFNLFMIFTDLSFFLILFVILGLSLFAFFLIYGTQTNIAGNKRLRTNNDPISGAVLVYIDIGVMLGKTCDLLRQLIIRERT